MKRILYIGSFEMPDLNAAAQRVLSISKALRDRNYDVSFYGITYHDDQGGMVDGFNYDTYQYPKGSLAWLKYALGSGIIDYIKKKKPDFVILYNYPAIAQERIIAFCRKNGIKTVGDITEWYEPSFLPKRLDTNYRMIVSNKHLDGIIVISRYLADYYKNNNLIQLPPMVDKKEKKWDLKGLERKDNLIRLVYIGTGSKKDRLDKIINSIRSIDSRLFHLDVIGIDEKQYEDIYHKKLDLTSMDVVFHGRLPHQQALVYLISADFQIFFRDFIRKNNAGFPTKFAESMSAGIPVITNKISNIDDYVINGVNSFMIDNLNDDEIREVLKRVSMLNRTEIDGIKNKCLKEEFDYRRYSQSIDAFMKSL